MSDLQSFLDALNDRYLELHRAKEEAFWDTRMGIADRNREFVDAELALKRFLGDAKILADLRARRAGSDVAPERAVVLDGWILMFSRNQVEDEEARAILSEIVERETELQTSRGEMKLGLIHPKTGEFQPASSVFLGNILRSDPDEEMRRAAFEGLRSIETHVLEHGFIEVVKLRNRFARRLGFADFYEYKSLWTEGFDKKTLFDFLDDLERRTRDRAREEIAALEERAGAAALRPWNFNFNTWGSLQDELDPYFRFEDALERWALSFDALGVRYREARVTLDLLDRKGKYENGFMHGTVPAFRRRGGWLPAEINFTANAVPEQVGSGFRAVETLFHEGGHAAHFANVLMDAPCFSQESAPTSVALAETQAMFMDRLIDDVEWQVRYARDAEGHSIPVDLVERVIRLTHPFEAQNVRSLLAVCYAEKALYEAPESELTPAGILAILRDAERRIVQLPEGCPRPTLAVPHLLASEASCYYHGYVLAHMAVAHTREHFLERHGSIVDNPAVGRELSAMCWAPGNSKGFLDVIRELTGKPFSADALAREIGTPTDEVVRRAKETVKKFAGDPPRRREVDLDVRLRVIHGKEVVVEEGRPPLEAARLFRDWIREHRPRPDTVTV